MILPSLLACAALASPALAACSREQLEAVTAAYVKAQAAGDPGLLAFAADASYLENDKVTAVADGALGRALAIDFDRSIHDTTACAAFTELTAASDPDPRVIHTRILLAEGGEAGALRVAAIESVVARTGDWAFNATGHLYWTRQEAWGAIPAERRDAREVIQAAGDAYLDSWGDGGVTVPYGTPCARLEGGAYTGGRAPAANTCTMPAFPEQFTVGNRRYVVDEELGAVSIFNDFPFIDADKPEGTPSTNLIRVEDGKIRYIHEVTVCTNPGCGR
ncbi:hypothetical protein GGS23DRAFT_599294 [Durotheca rogersii]|uniref:uncharacterized protein n=1 Tax=Durotheca rogersii TaxID=419775 RepID=UPI00222062AB|nr:uncharacterized protein GGS23DRAFT_599294 [Durotheca rogersii]KAI5860477.1 hypothetical protein GGS23DRAFT_599294 [Durotheca rogersii]